MRDIKFRAWDKKTQTMRTMDSPNYVVKGSKFTTQLFGDLQWFFGEFEGDYELMQYTGLKDKNGKEIYEGDIINTQEIQIGYDDFDNEILRNDIKMKVVFHSGAFVAEWKKNHSFDLDYAIVTKKAKIIGNIYENPELIK